ncbi:unnamed protein product [Mytilus coruscus]|uniref:Uncharacterized protein n=1 Tax=Mytilus coruscus TaxID=42192 RepID=A0A6J8BC61_MYTCO|nr:unnamed protein product [Mytilus coruscus]
MALSEKRKLMEDNCSIIEGNGDDQSVSLLLNTFINLVSSIDKRLQVVEKGIEKFGEIKNIITSLNSRVMINEQGLNTCQTKVTELETNVQGIGNLFDDVKARCDRNKSYVLDNAYRLRNTRCGITQQFPKEIEDRRRKLYPVMKEAKLNRRTVTLVRDRLFRDNELYQIRDEVEKAEMPYQGGSSPPRQSNATLQRQSYTTPPRN